MKILEYWFWSCLASASVPATMLWAHYMLGFEVDEHGVLILRGMLIGLALVVVILHFVIVLRPVAKSRDE